MIKKQFLLITACICLGIVLPGCAILRHEYNYFAEHVEDFNKQLSGGSVQPAALHTFYEKHLARYITQFDTASHHRIDSLLNTGRPHTTVISATLRGALYKGAVTALHTLPECNERYLHTETYRQLKYLYHALAPMVNELSEWSGRDDLGRECTFQLDRLKIFPYSISAIKASLALKSTLARVFLLAVYRELDSLPPETGDSRNTAWSMCRLRYRYLHPWIEKEKYRQQLDSAFNGPVTETDIAALRRLLARAMPRTIEKVSVGFTTGT